MVGYWGLGTGWIFEMTVKEEKDAELLQMIKASAQRQGKSLLYSDIEKARGDPRPRALRLAAFSLRAAWRPGLPQVLTALSEVSDTYSKWLVVLSDLVDLEHKTEAESTKKVNKTLLPMLRKVTAVSSTERARPRHGQSALAHRYAFRPNRVCACVVAPDRLIRPFSASTLGTAHRLLSRSH